jgi:hypothetical protein
MLEFDRNPDIFMPGLPPKAVRFFIMQQVHLFLLSIVQTTLS